MARVDTRWLSSTGGAEKLLPAVYEMQNGERCLRLEANVAGSTATYHIREADVERWACDHDYLVSECGRCVDCGKPLV